jgi:hypothetical protein
MPTKDRREREKRQRNEKKALDDALANAPPHVRRRLGQPSKIGGLSNIGPYNRVGVKFTDEGFPMKREDPEELGANAFRHDEKVRMAEELREKYRGIWDQRGVAKRIAHETGLSVETIRRYMVSVRGTRPI